METLLRWWTGRLAFVLLTSPVPREALDRA